MSFLAIILLGLAMATDAFAVAVTRGATMRNVVWREALRIGLIMGVVEGLTPIIGWAIGSTATKWIDQWDHWVAFALLGALGLHLIYESFQPPEAETEVSAKKSGLVSIAIAGLATSLDALAAGVGLAFVDVPILEVAAVIACCTFAMVSIGIKIGPVFGSILGKRAELIGGLILILIGASFVYEHYSRMAP